MDGGTFLRIETKSTRRRHEVRDETGYLIAIIDEVVGDDASGATMIELACDLQDHAYRVRLFPRAATRPVRRVGR